MVQLVKAAGVLLLMLFVFFCFGTEFMTLHRQKEGAGSRLLSGFLVYFFLFEFFAFPMMVLQQPLSRLSLRWGSFVVGVTVWVCLTNRKAWAEQWRTFWRTRGAKPYPSAGFWLFCLLLAVQCLFVLMEIQNTPDAAYYVANVSTDVATNSINRYEPFTGNPRTAVYARYLFGMYPTHNALISQVTGVHPLVVTKSMMAVFSVLFSYLLYGMIGRQLLKDRQADVWKFLCFLCVAQVCFCTTYSNAGFLLVRGYEGKAMLANIVIPAILYLGLRLFEKPDSRLLWHLLFCTAIAGPDISMSGMTIVPVTVSAVIVPLLLKMKRKELVGRYLLCLLPSVLLLAVYLLVSKGILTFPFK